MDKKPREIPDADTGNPFRNLAYLLERGVSVATLATAIEKCGIYTTDQYGRSVKAKDPDVEKALKYLALYRAWQLDRDPGTNMHREMDPFARTAGDETPYSHSGWAQDILPNFGEHGDDDHVEDWLYWQRKKSLTVKQFCILRLLHEPRTFETDRDVFLESSGTTLGVSVEKSRTRIERALTEDASKRRNLGEWIEWSESVRWWVPFYMRTEAAVEASGRPTTKAVTSQTIKAAFQIPQTKTGRVSSDAWWSERLSEAKRYNLVECRAVPGRGARQSTWYPERIAAWLIDKNHTNESTVAAILRKKFPDCAEYADLIDPPA